MKATRYRVAISARKFGFADRLPIRQKNFKATPTDPRSDADFPRLPILSAAPIFPDCRFSRQFRFSETQKFQYKLMTLIPPFFLIFS